MLVVSISDFLGNPAHYVERARHVPVQIENAGEKPITLSVRKSGVFTAIANLFKPKLRPLGTLAEKRKRQVHRRLGSHARRTV